MPKLNTQFPVVKVLSRHSADISVRGICGEGGRVSEEKPLDNSHSSETCLSTALLALVPVSAYSLHYTLRYDYRRGSIIAGLNSNVLDS